MKRPTLSSLAVIFLTLGGLVFTLKAPVAPTNPGTPWLSVTEEPTFPPGTPFPPRPSISGGISALEDPLLPRETPLPPSPLAELA